MNFSSIIFATVIFTTIIFATVIFTTVKYILQNLKSQARKDVERAFGVLQARFSIVRGPARLWKLEVLKDIMKACIILHNMIIEDKRNANELDCTCDTMDERPTTTVIPERSSELLKFINTQHCIRDKEIHSKLQADLVEHQWNMHRNY